MEKKILKQYVMTVFSDGSIETKEVPEIFNLLAAVRQAEQIFCPVENKGSQISSNTNIISSNTNTIDYRNISSRIGQILQVLEEIGKLKNTNYSIEEADIFTTAVRNVATTLEVETASVADKLGRQLGETAESIRKKIFDAYNNQNDAEELKNLLLNNVSSRNKLKDTEAIHFFFDNIFNQIK